MKIFLGCCFLLFSFGFCFFGLEKQAMMLFPIAYKNNSEYLLFYFRIFSGVYPIPCGPLGNLCWAVWNSALSSDEIMCFSCSSVEKILEFSGAKWYTPGLEPVIVHDILSDSIPDIRDNDSMEITAMMHEGKEDGDLLNSTSDLTLEDDPDQSNMPVDLQDYLDEWKGCCTFPGRDFKAYETIANPMDQIMQNKPKEIEETRSHSGPSGKE